MSNKNQSSSDISPDEKTGQWSRHDYSRRLVERYRAPLVRYFMRHVSTNAEAEDLAQAVFLRVMQKVDMSEIENPEAFLFRMAVNLLRDRARRDKARIFSLSEYSEQHKNLEGFTPERVLLGKESLDLVLTTLNQLSEKTRDILLLHRLEKMKYHEIAALYGISVSAVEKHIIKALAHLARHMESK